MTTKDDERRIDDALSYPLITQEVDSSRRSGAPGTSSGSQYAQVVQGALRDILGWRTRDNDPKGFTAALTQSFEPVEAPGTTKWKWTPHSYAIQADLGAITGAQAAIYARAKVALDQSLPLLNGLKPLRADVDVEDAEADRAIVRSSLMDLVRQLGEEGGPLNTRVDGHFTMLLGAEDASVVPTDDSQLGLLRRTFGLERARVNTISEEQNLTNFLILVDYVNSLRLTWTSQSGAFDRTGSDVFLGTQSVLLGRALAVVAEGVQETYFAMDSVFLGQAEREITELELDVDGTPTRLFIGEMLGWVEHFALDEGPRLIKEGGKDGVIHSFRPTIEKLTKLVKAAANASHNGSTTREPALLTAAANENGSQTNPTASFHSVRVGRALDDLSYHLEKTAERADQIKREPPPSIANLLSSRSLSGGVGRQLLLTVFGKNFNPDATIHLEDTEEDSERTLGPLEILLAEKSQLIAAVDPNEAAGEWVAVIENPDGQSAESDPFTILNSGNNERRRRTFRTSSTNR